jgi:hypothetical protein
MMQIPIHFFNDLHEEIILLFYDFTLNIAGGEECSGAAGPPLVP